MSHQQKNNTFQFPCGQQTLWNRPTLPSILWFFNKLGPSNQVLWIRVGWFLLFITLDLCFQQLGRGAPFSRILLLNQLHVIKWHLVAYTGLLISRGQLLPTVSGWRSGRLLFYINVLCTCLCTCLDTCQSEEWRVSSSIRHQSNFRILLRSNMAFLKENISSFILWANIWASLMSGVF